MSTIISTIKKLENKDFAKFGMNIEIKKTMKENPLKMVTY